MGVSAVGMGASTAPATAERSEEHTSELQYANISYAVFCLKKKKKSHRNTRRSHTRAGQHQRELCRTKVRESTGNDASQPTTVHGPTSSVTAVTHDTSHAHGQ